MTMQFAPGMHVFPGGRIDPGDSEPEVLTRLEGFDPQKSAIEIAAEDIHPGAFWVGGFRELFEEAGVIIATRNGAEISSAEFGEICREFRFEVQAGRLPFRELLVQAGIALPAARLRFFDHWVTPATQPRRFDTRFFLVSVGPELEASHAPGEAVSGVWVRPSEALSASAAGKIGLLPPTFRCLSRLSLYGSVGELMERYTEDEFARNLADRRKNRAGPSMG